VKRVLIALAGAALLFLPGVASAQTPVPAPTTIAVANTCGLVTLTLTGPDDGISGVHGFRWNAVNGDVATDEGVRTGTVVVADGDVKTVEIPFVEDEFGGTAAVTVAVFFGPNSHVQVPLDIYPVDTDCLPPATATPTTTPPVETVPPTLTPLPGLDDDTDGDFDQIGGTPPVGGVSTGG
jgi:hypothetical protein